MLAYWNGLSEGHDVPDRARFDPSRVPSLLPHLFMLEATPDGRWRYRLMGTEIVERFGIDATGRYVDEFISGAYLERMNELFFRALSSRAPVHSASRYQVPDKEHLYVERLMLPFTNGKDGCTIVLTIQVFDYVDDITRVEFARIVGSIEEDEIDIRETPLDEAQG